MRYTIAIFAILLPVVSAFADDRPNVVVILADDMGLDSVSALNPRMGMRTPAIDQLARAGMSFTDAHSTSSVCSPTRYGLLTGRYNWRSRLKRGIVGKWERPLFEDARLTLPEMFREKGYDTACIGKWHLGWHWPKQGGGTTEKLDEIDFTQPVKGGPCDHGFDYYFGDDVPNWPPYAWREDDRVLGPLTTTMEQGVMVGVNSGPSVEDWDFRAVLAEYTRRWSDYIRDRADNERPFFLYAPMPSPHTPIAPHDNFRGRSQVSEYADFLIQTDHAVGAITNALSEAGLAENTIVFFTCDNGTSPQAHFAELDAAGIHLNENWRGWKADAYEGGHRVPFIVRWPGRIKARTQSTHTITLADIMATCADVIGYDLPANAAEDSVSLLPTLRGESAPEPLHGIVVHHSGSGHFAVRKGDWKLLFCRGSGGWSPPREPAAKEQGRPPLQLYNLADDPKETTNLQSTHAEIVDELTQDLRHIIEQGRSTKGPRQHNHGGASWWPGLPFAARDDTRKHDRPGNSRSTSSQEKTTAKTSAPQKSLRPIPDKLVVLSFDDCNKSDRLIVADILKQHGFGATFYVTEGLGFLKNKNHYTTWEEIRELHDMGFEIGNHTQHHRGVASISGEQLKASVRHIEKRCAEYGIPKPTTFCYPGFGHTLEAVRALEEVGVDFARRGVRPEYQDGGEGSRGPAYDPTVDHPLLIPSTGYDGPNWTMEDLKWAVEQARDGKIAVLCFHGVPALEHPWVNTDPEDFKKYMQYLKDQKCTVIAMRDLVRYVDPSIRARDPYAAIKRRVAQPTP